MNDPHASRGPSVAVALAGEPASVMSGDPLAGLIDLTACPEALGPRRRVIGRDAEVAQLRFRLYRRELARGVVVGPVVFGPSGVGKTAILREAIRQQIKADRSPDRLARLSNPDAPSFRVDNSERYFRRFFMARPDWVAGASLEDLERMLDALNVCRKRPSCTLPGSPIWRRGCTAGRARTSRIGCLNCSPVESIWYG
jgi:hypothetical protein